MRVINLLFCVLLLMSCGTPKSSSKQVITDKSIKVEVNKVLDKWHKDAANANFDAYFSAMTTNGIFIGTDASEHWTVNEFKAYAKPHFDKGKAWSFTPLQRHLFINETKDIVWFDELLDTQMELCRGSGVLKRENNQWKIAHYVLSLTIPNEKTKEIVAIKKKNDSIFTFSLQKTP